MMFATSDALGVQLYPGLLRPVGFACLGVHPQDLAKQLPLAQSASPGCSCPPLVIAAARYVEHRAHALEREPRLMVAHECVPHRRSLAKYAAAFFKISRSSVTRLSSAFNRASSLCSLFARRPAPANAFSPLALRS